MKAKFYRRFSAYVIDIILLGTIITMSLMLFSNNNAQNIDKLNNEVTTINEQLLANKISLSAFAYRYADITNQIDKMKVIDNILNTLYIILLFIYIPYLLKGQTLGMKLLKLKVVKDNGETPSLNDYLIRSILIYSLGYLIFT
jgi:uncharacterized RDD family membrane protein YckC